ncbi:MAG: minor capsid protein, partial [Myxococcota bacterium]|nr:minor capsid protein [Myxococcota bacterium]
MASADDIETAQQAKLLRYWEHRAQAKVLAVDRTEDAVNRDVLKAYAAATNAVEDELRAFYERFASESGLSVEDARATLSLRERADFRADLARKQDAIRALPGPLSEELQAYLEELGEASKLRKVTRQQRLLLDIEHELTSMSADVARRLEAGMEVAFAQRFEGNAKDLEKVPAFRAELGAPAPRLLEQATAEKWLGQNFSDRVWDDKEKLVNELRRILSQAAVSHSGIEDLTKKMAKAMGSSLDNARRLVRTELNYVANQAALEGYRKSGVKHYKFLAAIDSRTSELCRQANGQVLAVAEAEVGVNFPPLHPNCRSTTVAHFTDEDLAQRYDFSHIQLSDEELAELGVSREDAKPKTAGGEPIELTQREAQRAEDAVNKAPLEGESLRVNARLERLAEDLRFERELEQTLDKGKAPHTPATIEVRNERLKEFR